MKCQCCDRTLSDYEATVKHKETGEYLDMCNPCRRSVVSMSPFEIQDRPDLLDEFHTDDEDFTDSGADLVYNDYQGSTES